MPSISNLNYEVPVLVSPSQIETIAIIGGGASGAIILDSLLKEPNSRIKSITIFERQQKVGGSGISILKLYQLPIISLKQAT